jgi:2-hydroxychromene-2-carboxylate isomerase
MNPTVEFFFDVGSPYSYLAYKALPAIAARTGATIAYRPMLLGGVFKATGNHSPAEIPAKGRWTSQDLRWTAEYLGVPFERNPHFPVNTLMLMRGATGMQLRRPAEFLRYLDVVFDAMWVRPRNLNEPGEVGAALAAGGFDPQSVLALANDAEVKEALKRTTEEAVARGVFGAPSFFVGERMWWGQDRLDWVERALAAQRGT